MFYEFTWRTGILFDDSDGVFPSTLSGLGDGLVCDNEDGTHFGFVLADELEIRCRSGQFVASAGMYFSIPGDCQFRGPGKGIVISRHRYQGFFQLGGPVEATGRLRYIDGCSDSLLVSPAVRGDACLNLLHIPPGTHQTAHTHPSLRAGVIVRVQTGSAFLSAE